MFSFDVVTGATVRQILHDSRKDVMDIVRRTYRDHHAGDTVNPDSYFIRFPGKSDSRIIALPAFVGGRVQLAGIKWISSFPANIRAGVPRAAAVLILNDPETGYPIACLEAATISSARTAASAALAATVLRPGGYRGTRIAFIGAGIIARNICDYLREAGCVPDSFIIHDIHEESGQALTDHVRTSSGRPATFTADLGEALDAQTVVFATTALEPYVTRPLKPSQLILNISLRDLAPEVVAAAGNILDDVEHCLKENTSPHLAEQMLSSRDFVTGTLADVLRGEVSVPLDRPVVFSPFGLGVLDLAVGAFVYARAREAGTAIGIPDFFGETVRW